MNQTLRQDIIADLLLKGENQYEKTKRIQVPEGFAALGRLRVVGFGRFMVTR